ncbi:MAG: aminopeptidase P family protein, partial [Bacteroidetes bacterium]
MTVNEKLRALRAAMRAHGVDACLVPSNDPHHSEYVAEHWKARQWLTGFTGSAGVAVVTRDHAGLWTDSRYFLQAEAELQGSDFVLHKQGIPHAPEHLDWLKSTLPEGARIAVDGRLFSRAQLRAMRNKYAPKNIELVTDLDLIGPLWTDRPPLPEDPVFEHELRFAGLSRSEKMDQVRKDMGEADWYLLTTLDDIAWLFNLRGSDVKCNPVFYAYALLGKEKAFLFVAPGKVPEDLKHRLNAEGVILKPYEALEAHLRSLGPGEKVHLDAATANVRACNALREEQIVEGRNLVAERKCIKNPTEIEHIRRVMVKDGVALTRLFRWLEKTLQERPVPEVE